MSLGLVSSLDLLGDIGGAISGAASGAFDQVIIPLLRTICFFFDSIVYSLIAYSYTILLYLASIDLGSVPYLKQIVSRLYVLLGIFMLFKVSFSIIQYIADPNSFTDKGKGFGKLVTNVLVSVVLLISVPTIFEAGYKLQGFILESNAIGKLIMGNSTGGTINVNNASSMAKDVQFLMYGAFFSINGDGADLKACKESPILGSTTMARSYETGDTDCLSTLNDFFDSNEQIKKSGLKLTSFFKTGDTKEDDNRNFGGFGVLASAKQSDNTWVANYLPIVSALAGGYVALLLIMFCVDIAVRVIKLCFLQMVAPISIISYIDPKESISDSKLRKWISETLKTYLSLFIRLATIFLVMVLIQLIANTVLAGDGINSNLKGYMKGIDTSEIDWSANMFIYVFLVIGAFMFAKKVPQMVENLFGIKMTGELHLASTARNLGLGIAGGAVGSLATAAGSIGAARNQGLGWKRTLAEAGRGFVTGGTRGTIGGVKSKGKGFMKGATSGVGAASRSIALRDTTHFTDRMGARFRNAMGMQSAYEGLEGKAKTYDSIANHASAMEDRAKDQLAKKDDRWKLIQQQRSRLQKDFDEHKVSDTEYTAQLQYMKNSEDALVKEFIDEGGIRQDDGTYKKDDKLAMEKEMMSREMKENKFKIVDEETKQPIDVNMKDWDSIKKGKDKAEQDARDIRRTDKYENKKTVDEAQKSGLMQSHINGK